MAYVLEKVEKFDNPGKNWGSPVVAAYIYVSHNALFDPNSEHQSQK